MKAILLSMRPKWCGLTASGKKTAEIRKTRPKLDSPFKVYIYCTIGKDLLTSVNGIVNKPNEIVIDLTTDSKIQELNGKVIGEFTCYNITYLGNVSTDSWEHLHGSTHEYLKNLVLHSARLTEDELLKYGGKYAWHISNLVIYDTPKELSEFFYACDKAKGTDCSVCVDRRENKCKAITRAPQSWCYVEEHEN